MKRTTMSNRSVKIAFNLLRKSHRGPIMILSSTSVQISSPSNVLTLYIRLTRVGLLSGWNVSAACRWKSLYIQSYNASETNCSVQTSKQLHCLSEMGEGRLASLCRAAICCPPVNSSSSVQTYRHNSSNDKGIVASAATARLFTVCSFSSNSTAAISTTARWQHKRWPGPSQNSNASETAR